MMSCTLNWYENHERLFCFFSRSRRHPPHEEPHCHRRLGHLHPLPRHRLPVLLHQVVQELQPAAVQRQTTSVREQRHTEAAERSEGAGRGRIRLPRPRPAAGL